jgi:Cu(I)-responsive transcriptional regulator
MNIGEAARASGLTRKMVRHYERIGLLAPATRSDSGYRRYGERELAELGFIRQARELGFALEVIGALLSLWRDTSRRSADVRALATQHAGELDRRIRALERMKAELLRLAKHCHGDERPECPILDELAAPPAAAARAGATTPGSRAQARAGDAAETSLNAARRAPGRAPRGSRAAR